MSDDTTGYHAALKQHYRSVWKREATVRYWPKGPLEQLPYHFCVLEFPQGEHAMWTYATCGMSVPGAEELSIELHLFSPERSDEPVEILTAITHYHLTCSHLALGHTVNFGKPWMDESLCSFGLISLPYLDGPNLELFRPPGHDAEVHLLWLIPITATEREFKVAHGLDALEQRFEAAQFNYLDPKRASVV